MVNLLNSSKRFWILTFFCLLFQSAISQSIDSKDNTIRLGLNVGSFDGAFYMPTTYLEYTYQINKWLGATPRVMWGRSNRLEQDGFDARSFVGASLSASFTPIPNKAPSLKLHFGGVYQNVENTYGWVPNPDLDPNIGVFYYDRYGGFGFIGSLSYDIFSKKKFEGGIKADMLTYFDEGYLNAGSFQLGIYFGIKF